MRRKICLIQPTYRGAGGQLLKGRSLPLCSCALPALAAAIPPGWVRETCLEYFDDVDFGTDASVVGISSMGYDVLHGAELAAEFRRRGKVVLFGGYQAHFSRDRLRDVADSIVLGHPGPRAMDRILADVEAGSVAPEYETGTDINFPFDYSMLVTRRIGFMPLLTSVGCRNRCDFCCTAARHGGEYRLRKLRHVLTDLRAIRRHTTRFAVVDSNLYNNREYLLRLCSAIVRERLGMSWGAEATLDIAEDEEVLAALRRAGCRMLYLGFESLRQASLDSVHKPYDASTYRRALDRLHRHGFLVAGYFLVGLDADTTAAFDELFDFIHDTRINLPVINIPLPAPGTALFDRLRGEGRLRVRTEDGFLRNALFYANSCSRCFYEPRAMTAEELETGLLALRRRLSSVRETLRRSLVPDALATGVLLRINLQFRRDSRRMAAAWGGQRHAVGSAPWQADAFVPAAGEERER